MSRTDGSHAMRCEEARERIHLVLDGDLMEASLLQQLEAHLADCAECRTAEAELKAARSALRALPQPALPADALEEVWRRTSRTRPQRASARSPFPWRALAAAASLAIVLFTAWMLSGTTPTRVAGPVVPPSPPIIEPTEEEIARAAEQTRMVFRLTASAMRKAKEKAFKDVLADDVSPALQRLPFRLPGGSGPRERESRNDV